MEGTSAKLAALVARHLARPIYQVTDDALFIADLGADSLDLVELTNAIEIEFDLDLTAFDDLLSGTFGEARAVVEKLVALKGAEVAL